MLCECLFSKRHISNIQGMAEGFNFELTGYFQGILKSDWRATVSLPFTLVNTLLSCTDKKYGKSDFVYSRRKV